MVSLSVWVSSWIDRRSIRLAASTLSGYRSLLDKYITPSPCGALPLDEIKPEDLIVLLSPLIRDGHTRAAQLLQVLVGAALRDACRQRILCWSPMDCVDRIRHHKTATAWLTADQAARLLDAETDKHYYVAWLLALCCGLRRGELLGLKWADFDFVRGLLHVRRQKVRVAGKIIEGAPKTETSIRDIPLSDDLVSELRGFSSDGYVLSCSDRQLGRHLRLTLSAAGLPDVTLHGLRHTMAATAATEGIPIKVLQGILGHAQYSTTADIYAHVDWAAARKAANIISMATIRARANVARLEIV